MTVYPKTVPLIECCFQMPALSVALVLTEVVGFDGPLVKGDHEVVTCLS